MTASKASPGRTLVIGEHSIAPGETLRIDLPAALLPTRTQVHLPLTVINGKRPGPVLWVSAALHGDELNGIEVISRVLDSIKGPLKMGALIAVPIVNIFGFLSQSRYFPDRRDLNRSFPGSKHGSLASRIAHLFLEEVVSRSTHGIDLHTGSNDRSNYPQTRGNLKDPETKRLAEAFGAPVMAHSSLRDGSLRAAATKLGIPAVVYEAGEAQRFNDNAITVGTRGVLNVMHTLGLLGGKLPKQRRSLMVEKSTWVRARRGGLVRLNVAEGAIVEAKQILGTISDPFGEERTLLRAPFSGIVIGMSNNPVAHGGDAILHLGSVTQRD